MATQSPNKKFPPKKVAMKEVLTPALLYFFATSTKFILATIFFNLFAVLFSQPLRSSMTKIVGEGGRSSTDLSLSAEINSQGQG